MLYLQNTNTNVRSAIFSNKGTEWLKTIDLSWIDRMAVDVYLDALVAIQKQKKYLVISVLYYLG